MASGEVSQMTYEEIARLDAGSHFAPAFAGAHVPTLAEALDLVGSRCRINIEIKSLDLYGSDASDGVAALIRHRNLYDQVIVSSFNPIALIKMRHLDARIALGMLYDDEMPAFFREGLGGAADPARGPTPSSSPDRCGIHGVGALDWGAGQYLDRKRSGRGAAPGSPWASLR